MTENRISRYFRSIRNFYFFGFFGIKWLPAAILDDRKSLVIAFLAISDQYATFSSQNGCRRPFWMTENRISRYFRSIRNFNFFGFFGIKWLPAAILDDRKSLVIAFLAISDQYATFFSQNGCRRPFWMTENCISRYFRSIRNFYFFGFFGIKWLPAAILDNRKSLLIAILAISDQYATFFLQNGCSGGHFG